MKIRIVQNSMFRNDAVSSLVVFNILVDTSFFRLKVDGFLYDWIRCCGSDYFVFMQIVKDDYNKR